jgi:hypothetical protein
MLRRNKVWLEQRAPGLALAARLLLWYTEQRGRESRRRLRGLQGRYRGQRCFIIGNGPSLNTMDLRPLAREATFSLNRGYLLYDRIGAPTTFHVVVNPLVAAQWTGDLERLANTKLISWSLRRLFPRDADIIYWGRPTASMTPRFAQQATRDIWSGATVTYVALQLAYAFGFNPVILIGVDHRYQGEGKPHEEVVAGSQDPNHFDPSYFAQGVRWNLPDLETSELSYTLARHYYHLDSREILDATVGGTLTVFPKVDYATLFGSTLLAPSRTQR